MFTQATREKTFLKAAFAGPAGSGKSYTMLRLLHAMQARGLGKRIAIIETEAGKIKKYVGYRVDDHLWAFDLAVLTSFGPQEYIAALESAVRAGYDLVGIDSLSHEWQGSGGALELADKFGEAKRNQFAGWKDVTPMHNKFVEAILRVPAHVVATCRLKMDYVLAEVEKNGKTSTQPRKVGMAPIQRNGLEYEFEIFCSMDESHVLRVEKTICPAIDQATCVKPDEKFFAPVLDWLTTGDEIHADRYTTFTVPPEELASVVGRLRDAGCSVDAEKDWILKQFGVRELAHLSREQFARWMTRVEMVVNAATQGASTTPAPAPAAPVATQTQTPTPPVATTPAAAPTTANGNGHTSRPMKSLSGDARTDCMQLWEEYAHLSGWGADEKASAFKMGVLAHFGVENARDLRPDQFVTLKEKLIDRVKSLYTERGLAGAVPF